MEVNCKPLQDILGFLKVMGTDSATVVPSSNGWEFYSRDTTGCMMVSALLKKEAFPSGYDEWEPFAAELEFMRDNIAKRDKVDMLAEDGFLKINYGKSKCKRRLINLDETPRVIPKVKMEDSVAVLSDKLIELSGNKYMANNGSGTGIQVDINEQEISFSYESELDAYSETYDVLMANLPNEAQKSHYATQYIIPTFKALPKGTPVVIEMDDDKPIKLTLQTEVSLINVFIAPLITED